jgi:hypothetical protein
MAFINENLVLILAVLLGISEALALVPKLKANSIFQLVVSVLKALVPKKDEQLPK